MSPSIEADIRRLAEVNATKRGLVDVEAARKSLIGFKSFLKSKEISPPFHHYIGSRLGALLRGEVKRLIVILRPGFGKSDLGSRYFPAYAFGKNPNEKIIGCSYGDDLATSVNRDLQRIMLDEQYPKVFPDTFLGDANVRTLAVKPLLNSNEFDVMQRTGNTGQRTGNYRTASVGGNITGRRMSLGIIDDPLRGAADAESPVKREAVWNWYLQDFYTRALPEARILIIGTRWHEDDLIGRLLRKAKDDPKADQWEVIHFPWMTEDWMDKHSYDTREPGELLWPERYGYEEYERVRAGDSYTFSALYQGYPTAREGNAIRRGWYGFSTAIDFDSVVSAVVSYDIGYSDSPNADWTWGSWKLKMKSGRFITAWQHFGHWNTDARNQQQILFGLQVQKAMKELMPNVRWTLDLEGGVGPGYELNKQCMNAMLATGLPARLVPVRENKVVRATSYIAACEAGRTELYIGEQFSDYGFSNGTVVWVTPFLNAVTALQYDNAPDGTPRWRGGHDDALDCEAAAHTNLTIPANPFLMSL